MITSGYQEPAILRIPSIARKSSFPEGGLYVQNIQNIPPNRISSPENVHSYNMKLIVKNSPSYVPQDSPFSVNKQSSSFPPLSGEKMTNYRENTDFEELLLNFKIKYKHLEEKVQKLLQENDKLNEIVEKSSENMKNLKEKIEHLLMENERLQGITKRTNSISNINGNLSDFKKGGFFIEEEIESKTHIIINQNEQLNLTIREQFKELDGWKEKFREKGIELMKLETEYQNEKGINGVLQEKVSSLTKETEKINRILLEKYTETNTFAGKIKNIEEKVINLELENQRLKQNENFFEKEKSEFKRHLQNAYMENDKLVKLLDQKQCELEGVREIQAKIEILLSENNKLTETINKLVEKHKLEKKQLEDNYKEKAQEFDLKQGLENKLQILLEENEKLTNLVERKNQELSAFEQLEEKIELLVGENEKLNKALMEKRNEIEYWKKRYFEQI